MAKDAVTATLDWKRLDAIAVVAKKASEQRRMLTICPEEMLVIIDMLIKHAKAYEAQPTESHLTRSEYFSLKRYDDFMHHVPLPILIPYESVKSIHLRNERCLQCFDLIAEK